MTFRNFLHKKLSPNARTIFDGTCADGLSITSFTIKNSSASYASAVDA